MGPGSSKFWALKAGMEPSGSSTEVNGKTKIDKQSVWAGGIVKNWLNSGRSMLGRKPMEPNQNSTERSSMDVGFRF